jgi:hypothetical protein
LCAIANLARADQLQCNSERDAKRAAAKMKRGALLLDFCSHCEATVKVIRVESVEVVKDCDFELEVRGRELAESRETFKDGAGIERASYRTESKSYSARVDLAYVYIETAPNEFKWLGGELGLSAEVNVSKMSLPSDFYRRISDR